MSQPEARVSPEVRLPAGAADGASWRRRLFLPHSALAVLGLVVLVVVTRVPGSSAPVRLATLVALGALAAVHLHLTVRMWHARSTRSDLPVILGGTAAGAILLQAAPNGFSSDIQAYVMYGRISAVYGQNPAVVPPSVFSADPAFDAMSVWHHDSVSVYGPLWSTLSHGVTLVAETLGGSYAAHLILYRLLVLAGSLVVVWAVWRLLQRWRPDRQVGGTVLVAWSPLLLIETSSAHNDLVMLAFVGVGLVLVSSRRLVLGIAALTLAALVKWIAAVVLLVVVAALLGEATKGRDRWLRLTWMGGLVLGVSAAFYLAWGDPVRTIPAPFLGAAGEPINTVAEFVVIVATQADQALGWGVGLQTWRDGVTLISALLMVVVTIVVVVAGFRRRSPNRAMTPAVLGLLLLCLVAPRLWPWYALWPLMLAPLANVWAARLAGLFASSVLALYALIPSNELTVATATRSVWVAAPFVIVGAAYLHARRRAGSSDAAEPASLDADQSRRVTATG